MSIIFSHLWECFHWTQPNLALIQAQSGVIEIRDKRPTVAMYCHGIPTIFFWYLCMIWFSYKDKFYIKIIGYPRENDWNLHHQHFLFKIWRKQRKWHDILLFQLVWACAVFDPRLIFNFNQISRNESLCIRNAKAWMPTIFNL